MKALIKFYLKNDTLFNLYAGIYNAIRDNKSSLILFHKQINLTPFKDQIELFKKGLMSIDINKENQTVFLTIEQPTKEDLINVVGDINSNSNQTKLKTIKRFFAVEIIYL